MVLLKKKKISQPNWYLGPEFCQSLPILIFIPTSYPFQSAPPDFPISVHPSSKLFAHLIFLNPWVKSDSNT